jgi:hypothetical protein
MTFFSIAKKKKKKKKRGKEKKAIKATVPQLR